MAARKGETAQYYTSVLALRHLLTERLGTLWLFRVQMIRCLEVEFTKWSETRPTPPIPLEFQASNPENRHRLEPATYQRRFSSMPTRTLRSNFLDKLGMSIDNQPERPRRGLDDSDGMQSVLIVQARQMSLCVFAQIRK